MRITQWGEYGLLCSMYIAAKTTEGKPTVGAAEIADAHGIALQYAQQILHRLRRGDIIQSVRGPHGGYRLARTAPEITIGDVLTATEGDTFHLICETKAIGHERCLPDSCCGLKSLWQELKTHINDFMTTRTLQDLIDEEMRNPVKIGESKPSSEPCASQCK